MVIDNKRIKKMYSNIKSFNYSRFLNVMVVVLLVSLFINLLILFYVNNIYDSSANKNIPYRFNTSIKYIDYIITNNPTSVYYDNNLNSLFLYNSLYDTEPEFLIYNYDLEKLKTLFFNKYEGDVNFLEVSDNIISVSNIYNCDNMLLRTTFNKDNVYLDDLSSDVINFEFCFRGY